MVTPIAVAESFQLRTIIIVFIAAREGADLGSFSRLKFRHMGNFYIATAITQRIKLQKESVLVVDDLNRYGWVPLPAIFTPTAGNSTHRTSDYITIYKSLTLTVGKFYTRINPNEKIIAPSMPKNIWSLNRIKGYCFIPRQSIVHHVLTLIGTCEWALLCTSCSSPNYTNGIPVIPRPHHCICHIAWVM